MTTPTLALLKALMACPSITPNDAGCPPLIAEHLKNCGFIIESLPFEDVSNLWARYGTHGPLLVFAGHTDVVPPGPLTDWMSDPFIPTIRDDRVYGRGAADMKSGLAAMIIAAERFVKKNPHFQGSIAFLITSDEEGPSINGTQKVVEVLKERQIQLDYCLIGEATSIRQIGDQIRVGRRGSLHGKLTLLGVQGHIAFPELASNPVHRMAPFLKQLTDTVWDAGNAYFPPTTFQISNIHAGTGALNVIPGSAEIHFNFRFGTASTVSDLQERVENLLVQEKLDYTLEWNISGLPFLTEKGKLLTSVTSVILKKLGINPNLSTGGGTSDGRFIAPLGTEVLELGPNFQSVHRANENILLSELEVLTDLYEAILEDVFKA